MRCFLPCFGASKRQKQVQSANANLTGEGQTHVDEGANIEPAIQFLHQTAVVEEPFDSIAKSKIRFEEQSDHEITEVTSTKELIENLEKGSKKEQEKAASEEEEITAQIGENHEILSQEETSESLFSLSIGSRKQVSIAEKADVEVNSPIPGAGKEESEPERVQLQHDSTVLNPIEKEAKENTEPLTDTSKFEEALLNCIAIGKVNTNEEDSSAKELVKKLEENKEETGKAKLWNHLQYRYCNDEGYEDINLDESDLDVTFEDDDPPHNEKKEEEGKGGGDVNNQTWPQEESSESLFSLSADSRKRISSAAKNAENEVNSLMQPTHDHSTEEGTQERIPNVSSVLNPIENLTHRRVVKTIVQQSLNNDKENINSVVKDVDLPFSAEPSLKLPNRKGRDKFNDNKQEIGVDTSLSSWLAEPEATTPSSHSVGEHTPKGRRGSPWSHEERPILGALTLEEIIKYSVSPSSSRKSRSRSPDETPIIGTVGSYGFRFIQDWEGSETKNEFYNSEEQT